MPVIREEMLRRRELENERAGPEILHLGVYAVTDPEGRQGGFELRGQDPEGRVHFRFRDPRRLVVLDEFDITLTDLDRQYIRIRNQGNT
jgi:hypothetical protein